MKVLVVDDDGIKLKYVGKLIREIEGHSRINLETSVSLSDAKIAMTDNYYDFLILDLNMPDILGDDPIETAGTDFIDEIIGIQSIIKPLNIVILTSNEKSKEYFEESIDKNGFTLLNFDVTKKDWEEVLKNKLRYHMLWKEQQEKAKIHADVCVLTAVDVETDQLKRLWDKWELIQFGDDSTLYHLTNFKDKEGQERKIVIAQQSEMGMSAATFLSTKMLLKFQPKYLIMVGIAAGIKDDYHFGDIIVPNEIWNYSSGKYVDDKDNKIKLLPDSKSLHLDSMLANTVYQKDYTEVLSRIKRGFNGPVPPNELQVAKGPMACGAAVISDSTVVKEWILAHSRKTVGLDMESYGIFFSVINSYGSIAKPLCIKSISDFADNRKSDDYQKYSAYTSSAFCKYLLEHELNFLIS